MDKGIHRVRSGRPARVVHLLATLVVVGASAAFAAVPGDGACGPQATSTPSQRFTCARMLARDGRFDAAAEVYGSLSAEFPDNVDYVFGEAQARFWSGETERALELASRARGLAPAYEDVWALEYRILQEPSIREELRLREFRRAANSRFPDAPWLELAAPEERSAWYWESGIDRENLDNGADDWQSLYVHAGRRSPDGGSLSLTVTEHRRFSLADVEIATVGGAKLGDKWLLDGTLRLVPDAEFLPETIVRAGLGRILGNGWIAGGSLARRKYANESVDIVGVHVERYFGSFRAALHADNTRLKAASTFTYRGVVNYYTASGSRYGLTLAAGEEVEVIAPGMLLDMDVTAVALSGRHPVGNGLSVVWRLGTHRQGEIYRRNRVGLSIAGDF